MIAVDPWHAIEAIHCQDPGGRGIAVLLLPGEVRAAAYSLRSARRVVVVTGYYILSADACETDGPPGAWALGEALRRLDVEVRYLTDRWGAPLLEAAGLTPTYIWEDDAERRLNDFAPTHLVSIERPGRTADGTYRNMRGRDISACTGPVDALFLATDESTPVTIAVGDGGNEIGMGRVNALVHQNIENGPTIASVVQADHLIVAGTSNTGAWG
ncbi:MAG: glutamate cyclase domain-containing protein, partial [Planctomycetia bacterium]